MCLGYHRPMVLLALTVLLKWSWVRNGPSMGFWQWCSCFVFGACKITKSCLPLFGKSTNGLRVAGKTAMKIISSCLFHRLRGIEKLLAIAMVCIEYNLESCNGCLMKLKDRQTLLLLCSNVYFKESKEYSLSRSLTF